MSAAAIFMEDSFAPEPTTPRRRGLTSGMAQTRAIRISGHDRQAEDFYTTPEWIVFDHARDRQRPPRRVFAQ
jgi:hypothetical protein